MVAFTLAAVDPDRIEGLREAPRQLLLEHATCWTDPPAIAADVTTLLHQLVVAPWEGGAADDRPDQEVADDVLSAPSDAAQQAVHDQEAVLADFVRGVNARWAQGDRPRNRVWSPGPVRSSRFL